MSEECSICYETLYGGYTLECGHRFHEECIECCKRDVCPLCRRPFRLITEIYQLELECKNKIDQKILFRAFPVLESQTFLVINKTKNIINLSFQFLERRDEWFHFFNGKEEVIKLSKKDINVDIRRINNKN